MELYESLNREIALGSGTKSRLWAVCVALHISDRHVGQVAAEEVCEQRVCPSVPFLRDGSKVLVPNVHSFLGSCNLAGYSRHRLPRVDAAAPLADGSVCFTLSGDPVHPRRSFFLTAALPWARSSLLSLCSERNMVVTFVIKLGIFSVAFDDGRRKR